MQDLLTSALNPRSVAIIGASDNIHKIGGRPIYYMQRHGFQGAIYPINPSRAEIQGHKSYASLGALPEVPDLALVVVGGDKTVAAVEDCAARGVKSAVIIASGFGETGAAGLELQQHMVAKARAAGMRLYGPNTQGLANFGTGAIAGFSTMFIEVPPMDGPIGIVSQSGGMSAMTYGLLRGRGLGVRHVHATGNEADVTVGELALAVAHDPDVKLLLLYLESIANPEMLAAAAAHARERDLPIIAIKAGRSAQGQKAASSHTGSLANEDRTVDAFFRHHGIWRVRDPHEQARAAQAYLKGWRPEGRRLVVISNSGASCVMGADAADDEGLPLAELAQHTQDAVASQLPGFATASNPIDITAALLSDSGLFGKVLPAVAQDPAADLFFINIPVAGAGYDVQAFARDAAAFEATTGKPVAVAAWQESVAEPFRAQGIATFPNEGEALGVLAQVAGHTALMRRERTAWPTLPTVVVPQGAQGFLNEADSLALLARHGVPTVPMYLCRSAQEARNAFDAVGGRAVVKACSAEVPHKSEHGLVALGVASAEQAGELYGRFDAKMTEMGVARDGVIVAAMHKGQHEFMVGARIDPVFGPVVVVGDGGKYVEALQDVAVLLPPFSQQEVVQALRTLRIAPLIDGVRGDPPLDVAALADIAVAVGQVIAGARGAIASVDLNPVMVGAAGEGAVVVDALVECGAAAGSGAQPVAAAEPALA
ncbi:CoA-binding domain-containing protein [Acidovorax sp. NO-1]|uniref:acetate--CoA ligase family protein n=1 Tax=Acidovorax sp. NO-1 TaxID=512030 RepID=UPI00023FD076|nr:acetate--CoA ligase family protein [Acidovorax sp. NO-1]EHL23328.1 CoA-binding domain-containing protein [Acidovorax sp. NO-1]